MDPTSTEDSDYYAEHVEIQETSAETYDSDITSLETNWNNATSPEVDTQSSKPNFHHSPSNTIDSASVLSDSHSNTWEESESISHFNMEKTIPLVSLTNFEKGNHFECQNSEDEWLNIPIFPNRVPLMETLHQTLKTEKQNDFKVIIGEDEIGCSILVLSAYSEYITRSKTIDNKLVLPPEKVTFKAFRMIYDWMLNDNACVLRNNLIEVLNAAIFLEVNDLLKQIWYCIEFPNYFSDFEAFALHLEAAAIPGFEYIEKMTLDRIGKSFLCVVATTEFVKMSCKSLELLLSSDRIGVNNEKEIFFAAVRWINYDWPVRESYIPNIFAHVRFELCPINFTQSLKKPTGITAIDRITSKPSFKKILTESFFGQTLIHYGGDTEPLKYIYNQFDISIPPPRLFVYDSNCFYHKPEPNDTQAETTYLDFINYLRFLQTTNCKGWENFKANIVDNYKPK